MKKYLVRILYILIVLLSTFYLTITDTNAKTESKKVYYAKYSIENNIKEIQEEIKKEEKAKEQEKKEQIRREQEEAEAKERESSNVAQTSSRTETAENYTPSIETNNYTNGATGRLYIGGYSVGIYDFNVNTTSSTPLQTIVNNADSAAYYRNRGKLVIADHYYQGFSILVNLSEGATATIKFENGSMVQYRLVQKSRGVNAGTDLVDTEGNSFFKMNSDIIMYTCYEDGIMATLWVAV